MAIYGSTGFGKSKALEKLVIEQLRARCSVVVLDPKGGTFTDLLRRVEAMGVSPEQVTIISPQISGATPGFNPILAGIPVPQMASDFVSVLEASTSSWGPRMADMLTNALIVIGVHKLSLYELVRLLSGQADYREALLNCPVQTLDRLAYDEARTYFLNEFAAWGKAERAQAVGPVLNKVREIVRSPFLFPFLCSRTNTLDLSRLWHEQRIILVHLDRPTIGEEGTRIVAGIFANLLFRTALRSPGPGHVALVIDELATIERFVGRTLSEIVAVARSQRLRLITACQHFGQLSDGLREALMGNVGGELFFHMGHDDARQVATSLAAGTESQIKRLIVSAENSRRVGRADWVQRRHTIYNAAGQPLRVRPKGWRDLHHAGLFEGNILGQVQRLAASVGVDRLYVLAADTNEPVEVSRYVEGLHPENYWVDGPALTLVVSYPRIRITGVERTSGSDYAHTLTRIIQSLPIQHAMLRGLNTRTGVIKVADVPPPTPTANHAEFITHALQANGQSEQEVNELLAWRRAGVDRVTGGTSFTEENTDGSIF